MTSPPDLSDAFFHGWVEMCSALKIDPFDLIRVSYSESSVMASAHNIHGGASGIVQMMPEILMNLGWTHGPDAFRALPAEAQLPYVRAYYAARAVYCTSDALCYVATFLPALLPMASKMGPEYVLCGQRGPLAWAYGANRGLDVNSDGAITVQDLSDRLAKVCVGARYSAIVARLREAMGLDAVHVPDPPDTLPELPDLSDGVDDAEDTVIHDRAKLAEMAFQAFIVKKPAGEPGQ